MRKKKNSNVLDFRTKSRLLPKSAKVEVMSSPNSIGSQEDLEYREDPINWKDEGDANTDPSMNDFLRGYNINPYEFQNC